MKTVVEMLQSNGIDLASMNALEVFARDASWQTIVYVHLVKTLEAWEIDPAFECGLKENIPSATIRITDSICEIQKKAHFDRFQFVVVDNPQNIFGENGKYCEHFDLIGELPNILSEHGVVVFNVNREPFDYHRFPSWRLRREEFYRMVNTDFISLDWLRDFYRLLFESKGYQTQFCFSISREDYTHNDYLHYFVFSLLRKEH